MASKQRARPQKRQQEEGKTRSRDTSRPPDIAVPADLAQADAPTLLHMQRTLGNATVQRYLAARDRDDLFSVEAPAEIQTGEFSRVQRMFDPLSMSVADVGHKTQAPTAHVPTGHGGTQMGGDSHHSTETSDGVTPGKGIPITGDPHPEASTETQETNSETMPGFTEGKGVPITANPDQTSTTSSAATGPTSAQNGDLGATITSGQTVAPGDRPTLYQGMRGDWVTTLQNKMRALGYVLAVDGIFGSETRASVLRFQEEARLAVDGVVGRRTWEALDAVSRGEALSDEDMAELEATFMAALAANEAQNYAAAAAGYTSIYRDPRLATKPRMLASVVFNLAGANHNLAAQEQDDDARQALFDRAIALYQEFSMIPTVTSDRRATAAMRVREARMGLPPTASDDLAAQMNEMNPGGAAVPAGERPTLSLGSQNDWVTTLQNKLRALGYVLEITGHFDPITEAQVIRFQDESSLEADGVVGRRTWEALDAVARGQALSDADMAEMEATFVAATTAVEAQQYEQALELYGSLYRDPRLATKPRMLSSVIFNLAGATHNLAAQRQDGEGRQQLFDRAISLYQEFGMIPSVAADRRATSVIRMREARLGLPPTDADDLEAQTNEMNPDGAVVPPGERPTLSLGSEDEWVTTLQNKLRALGYVIVVSGEFDAATEAQVRRFQGEARLEEDGIVGRRTWEALDAVSRGQALSDADMAELEVTFLAASAAHDAQDYERALDLYGALYRDQRLATKPHMLASVIFNLAGAYHQLAIQRQDGDEQQQFFERAISLYQEYNMIPTVTDARRAAGIIRIREARMGLPPTPYDDLEADMHQMNPGAN